MRFTLPASLAVILTAAAVSITAGQSPTGGQSSVTFTKDIAPIFQNNCQVCHRPGSIAPMSLLTYTDARPWARSIKLKVAAREMPPWFIDKNVGVQHFSNDRSLSDRDIDTIVKLGRCGRPEEIPPTCRRRASSPQPKRGRSVSPMSSSACRKTTSSRRRRPTGGRTSSWIRTSRRSLHQSGADHPDEGIHRHHHIRTSIVEPTDATLGSGKLDDADVPLEVGEQGVFLNEYAIGKQGDVFPDGSGRLIKAGTKINFQMHLHATARKTHRPI
jgi:hypothetical protein